MSNLQELELHDIVAYYLSVAEYTDPHWFRVLYLDVIHKGGQTFRIKLFTNKKELDWPSF